MEGVYISMKRHLAEKHPIFRLLAPHFKDLIAINANGLESLIAPGHWIDNCTSIGRQGMLELIARGMEEWRMDMNGTLPHDLQNRGLSDDRVLPNYAYRDDAMKLYNCIKRYVSSIVNHYYDNPKKILGDWEIQGWCGELVKPKELGGAGINGVPGNGQLRETKEIIMICTSIIFTVTGQFASITLDQYDEYAFVPSYPTLLHGRPPMSKMLCTEEDLIRVLPSKRATLQTMALTKLLGQCAEDSHIGEMAYQYQYDKEAVISEEKFRTELLQLSTEMNIINEKRPPLYKYSKLDPKRVPNSISI